MTANRKADLQRKLTLAPVAKPPAGLAERIKREIPKDLRFSAETERERLSKAVAFNLRVAASILILVSSAFLGLQLLSRLDENKSANAPAAASRVPEGLRVQPKVATTTVAEAKEDRQLPAAPAVVPQKRVASRDRRANVVASAPAPPPPLAQTIPPAAAGAPAPAQPAYAMSERAANAVALDRAEEKSAAKTGIVMPEVETTTSPVSGNEMRYFAKDKNVEVITSKKLQDEQKQITPWASVSPAAKQKILEAELAAGADKKVVARIAREAGLTDFANSIERR